MISYRVKSIYQKIQNKIFFSAPLRPFIQGYLSLCMTTFIAVKALTFTGASEITNSSISLFWLLVILIIPIANYVVLRRYKSILL
jgi:small-conductance mechanosensitive channel